MRPLPLILLGWAACVPPFAAPRPRAPAGVTTPDTASTGHTGGPAAVELPDSVAEAPAVLEGVVAGGWAGDTVTGLAALGGDGPDLLVGAKGTGRVYALTDVGPGAHGLSTARVVFEAPEDADAAFGGSLAALTDASGAHTAIAIGAPLTFGEDDASAVGAVWIVSGDLLGMGPARDLDVALDAGAADVVQWVGPSTGSRAGISVAAGGDLDGDGHGDLIVGSLGPESGTAGAWILPGPFGRAPAGPGQFGLNGARVTLLGSVPGDQAGCSVARAGDLDGSGLPWVAVGACRHSSGDAANRGAAYVVQIDAISSMHVLGSGGMPFVEGADAEARLGTAVVGAGDLGGEGRDELLVQAHGCGYDFVDRPARCPDGTYGESAWYVYTVEGMASGPALTVPIDQNHFSCNGATSGRFVGDADALDLAIGVCQGAEQGAVLVLADVALGGAVFEPADGELVAGVQPGELAGAEVAAVSDGATLAIGAWKADHVSGLQDAGAVYLFPR